MTTTLPVLDTTDPAYWADPHAVLRAAREQGPVARDGWGALVVLGHPECSALLTDPRLRNSYDVMLTRHGVHDGPLADWWRLAMLNTNAPEHTRLRSLVSKAFTPRAVGRLRDRVRQLTGELLDAIGPSGDVDVVESFAHLLPIQVVCELLGVPRADHDAFNRWTTQMTLMFTEVLTDADRATAEAAVTGLGAYCRELIDERRAHPREDLLSALIAAEEAGDRLSADELVAMVVNLLNGGHDTTRSMLMITIALLAADPALADRLRAEPSLVRGAVEEALRLEPPSGTLLRTAGADLDVCGVHVSAGEVVALSVLAANRDPAVYTCPDAFRPERDEAPALTFGHGPHFCVGNAVARLELTEAIGVLLARWTHLRLAGPRAPWLPFRSIRCFDRLDVAFRTAAR